MLIIDLFILPMIFCLIVLYRVGWVLGIRLSFITYQESLLKKMIELDLCDTMEYKYLLHLDHENLFDSYERNIWNIFVWSKYSLVKDFSVVDRLVHIERMVRTHSEN